MLDRPTPHRSAPTTTGAARASPSSAASPRRWSCACSTTAARRRAEPRAGRRVRLAGLPARRRARTALRLPRARALGSGVGRPLQPRQAAARPVRARGRRARCGGTRPSTVTRPTIRTARTTRLGAVRAALGRWSPATSTGATTRRRARAMADSIFYEVHVKGFTKLHPGRARGAARHLRRAWRIPRRSRTCSGSASPRSSCFRCTSSCTTRSSSRAGCATTGATSRSATSRRTTSTRRRATAAARSTSSSRWSRALHARRPRGDPRRRLQPHRRGRRVTGRRCASAASTTRPTTGSTDDRRRYVDDTGCGNTVEPASAAGAAPGHGRAALLGAGDARRRLPLRPGGQPRARQRATSTRTRRSWRRSARIPVLSQVKLIAEPWDIGQGGYDLGTVPGRVERVERQVPRHRPRLLARPRRARSRTSPRASAARRTCSVTGARRPTASVNIVTVHDGFTLADLVSYDGKHNEANGEEQPRRHRRQPQLELRRRRADRRPGRARAARAPAAQLARHPAALRGRAAAARRRRVRAAPRAATTTPTARTTS